MASFRGIGDAATAVIENQNQRSMEATKLSETARQFDKRLEEQKAERAQQAAQFGAVQGAQQERLAEQSRQFEASRADTAEQQGWQRGMAEKQSGLAERQFAQQSAVEGKRLSLAEFGAQLSALSAESEMGARDVNRQMALAQLGQYVAATGDEAAKRQNREKLSKGAFGSLAVAAIMNGGVMPSSAIEIANRELGDKNNRIVGGGVDEESGIAFFDVQGADGAVKQLKMPPDKQYAVLSEVYGDEVASMFASNYAQNQTVKAAIERAKVTAEASMAKMRAEEESKRTLSPDKMMAAAQRVISEVDKQLARYDKENEGIAMTAAQLEAGQLKKAPDAATLKRIENYRGGRQAIERQKERPLAVLNKAFGGEEGAQAAPAASAAPAAKEVTPEMVEKYGIEPGYRTMKDPATGDTFVYWRSGGAWKKLKL